MRVSRRNFIQTSSMGAALTAMGGACAQRDQAEATDLARLDAVETASRIRGGEISAIEAVEAAIDRAERINPQINAIVTPTFDKARVDAVDPRAGVFGGVPSFVKDLDDVVGVPTGYGSRAFSGFIGAKQSPFINAFFDKGFVSLGKSATPEFGLTATTEPLSSGPARNPWNPAHSTGGSSGGAAALVASGVVPVAHASDGGGSIRIPASSCGTVGLKVSRGRYPAFREDGAPISIAAPGVESRTVRDTAAFIAAMELPSDVSGLPPVGLVTLPLNRPLRIGLYTDSPLGTEVDPQIVAAINDAGALCESLGHDVEFTSFPVGAQMSADFTLYWAFIARTVVRNWEQGTGLAATDQAFEPFTLGLVQHFENNVAEFEAAIGRLIQFEMQYEEAFGDFDVMLSPVTTAPPPKIGELRIDGEFQAAMATLSGFAQFTPPHNVSGAPAISLPLAWSSEGLPIGALFAARMGQERLLLELAMSLEEARPWTANRPAIYG